MPLHTPSQASFTRMQEDPSLLATNTQLVAEFESTPWLLPPRTLALPYAGVHELDRLLELRSTRQGAQPKTVTLLTFSRRLATITQNCIYSAVKFGGVRNHIVATWDAQDLAACADLNLPCADVTAFLPEPMDGARDAGLTGSHDYLVICWLRPALVAYLLQRGYSVLSTDSDIVFTAKPVWASYLAFLGAALADAAFQSEGAIFNGGSYVMLPTAAAIAFVTGWAAMAPRMLRERSHDQDALAFMSRSAWAACQSAGECRQARAQIAADNATYTRPLIRTFQPNFFAYWPEDCALSEGSQVPLIDPCDHAVMFLHPVCTDYDGKVAIFQHQGLWFMDNETCAAQEGATSGVGACQPLQWRMPSTESLLYSCPEYALGLMNERQSRL